MTQVLICHAYNTLPSENWYGWLSGLLEDLGYDARVLQLPNPSAPSEEEWVESIKVAHTNDSVRFVGHSLGCRAVLAYLNQYNKSAESVALVACPMFWDGVVDTRPPLKAYIDGMQELDFEKLKSLVDQYNLFHDSTDDLLPMKNVEYLKKMLDNKAVVHTFDKYGHFDVPEIPELAKLFSSAKQVGDSSHNI